MNFIKYGTVSIFVCVLYLFEGLSPLHYVCIFSFQLLPFNQLTNSDFQLKMP